MICWQKAKRSNASFSPSLSMKQTVLSLGPSIAGFSRRPVFTPDSSFKSEAVAAMHISKHICLGEQELLHQIEASAGAI